MTARGAPATQEWFSAAELAELALPGLPTTKRGVLNVAEREGWARVGTRLVRPRNGRGGGHEFHIDLVIRYAGRRRLAALLAVEQAGALERAATGVKLGVLRVGAGQ